jgi:hypothetical protein
MNKILSWIFAAILMSVLASNAYCVSISYEMNMLGGNRYEFSYTVLNDTLSVDIEEFTIFFEEGLYDNLTVTTSPLNWDPFVINPDPLIPDDGFYDALAIFSGISPGDQLGNFSVNFDWLGTGSPGAQYFEIINPFSFDVLASGNTEIAVTASAPVPEPSTILLFASGLGILAAIGRKRTKPI